MRSRQAVAAVAAAALAAGTGFATGAVAQTTQTQTQTPMQTQAQTTGQTTAQTKATVANEVGNPIDAPETVDPGQTVNVGVQSADEGARIELWGPVTERGKGEQIGSVPLTGGTAMVTAPQVSASYELRYVAPDGSTRAQRAFEVAASPVMLEVPTDVDAGATLPVTWRGPAKAGDMLQIVDPATGQVLQSTPVAGDPGAQNLSQLTVPDHRGTLELRYVSLDGTVLRSIAFEVLRLGG